MTERQPLPTELIQELPEKPKPLDRFTTAGRQRIQQYEQALQSLCFQDKCRMLYQLTSLFGEQYPGREGCFRYVGEAEINDSTGFTTGLSYYQGKARLEVTVKMEDGRITISCEKSQDGDSVWDGGGEHHSGTSLRVSGDGNLVDTITAQSTGKEFPLLEEYEQLTQVTTIEEGGYVISAVIDCIRQALDQTLTSSFSFEPFMVRN